MDGVADSPKLVLIFAPSFEPAVKAGGPARSLTNLVRALDARVKVDVVTSDRDLGDSEPFPGLSGRWVVCGHASVYYLDATSPIQVISLVRKLATNPYDLIVVNSVWNHHYSLIPVMLKSLHVLHGPVLLLPRGELEPGALRLKSTKKRLVGTAFRAVYRHAVDLFGATSEAESANISSWLPDSKVVTTTSNLPDVIPWGQPETRSTHLRAVFLSRIHPKKGLLPLLEGLRGVTRATDLAVVGPAEDRSYWEQCRRAVARLPGHVNVTLTGFAERDQIPPLLWNADCMVLLTAGENYGHVIAEALQAGCPVITTPTTPWTDVIRGGGGEIVENRDDPNEVAVVLDRWAAKSPDELAASRRHARTAFEQFQALSGPNIIELALQALAQPM